MLLRVSRYLFPFMRMILNCLTGLALCLGAVGWAGCGDAAGTGAAPGPAISAGTTQLADIARNVAGESANVNGILDANSDPHDYEPKPSDVEGVADADLILRSGGDPDLWLDQIIESSGSDAPVLTLIDHVETIEGTSDGRGSALVAEPAERHRRSRGDSRRAGRARPCRRDEPTRRTPAPTSPRSKELDAAIAACMEAVPAEQRKLVTSHDALGYYADRYGIDVIGAAIPALTTQAQPSAGETAELVDAIRSAGVSTIFPEAGVSAELESVIADEAGADGRRRALGRHARAGGIRRRDLRRVARVEHGEARRRVHRRRAELLDLACGEVTAAQLRRPRRRSPGSCRAGSRRGRRPSSRGGRRDRRSRARASDPRTA